MSQSKNYKFLFILLLACLQAGNLFAQEEKSDCVIKLEQAQGKYDQGRIQDVEPLIGGCLAGKEFDKVEKTQALKLLTLTYLYLEEPELAESTMLRLLETSHEFTVNEAIDPSEFINLYNKYRHDPLYSIGFLAGIVVANPIVTQLNSTQDLNNDSRQTYTPLSGFRAGANGEYKIFDKIYANAGVNFSSIQFQKIHQSTKVFSGVINENGFEATESQASIELALLINYHVIESRLLTPYISAGLAPKLLLSASYPGDAIKNEIPGSAPATSTTVELINDRNSFNLSAVVAAGLKFKVGEGFINGQLRYSHELFQSSKESSALGPNDPNLLWDLSESSDGFRLHDIGIALGYTLHFYKPKKLR